MSRPALLSPTAAIVALLLAAPCVAAQEAGTPEAGPTEDELVTAPLQFSCLEPSSPLELTSFALWLVPESILHQAPATGAEGADVIRARVGMLVRTKGGGAHAINLARSDSKGYEYYLDCQQPVDFSQPFVFPTIEIRTGSSEVGAQLRTELAERAAKVTASGSIDALLFHGETIDAAWTTTRSFASGTAFGTLMREYVTTHGELNFLASATGQVSISSIEPGDPKAIRLTQSAPPPSAEPAAPSAATPAAPTAAQAPPAAPAAPAAPTAAAAPAGGGGDADIPDPVPVPMPKPIVVSIGDPALAGIDLAAAGAVETFGYCARAVPDKAGSVALEGCVPGKDGKVPLQIQGASLIELDTRSAKAGAVQIGKQLRTAGYTVPYPRAWGNAVGDRIDVAAGELAAVLKRPIELRQWGLPGCAATVVPTLADLRAQRLTLPPPPCAAVDIVLPKTLVGAAKPQITSGCRPGSDRPAVVASGRIRCALKTGVAGPRRVKLSWASGFAAIELDLTLAEPIAATVDISEDVLLQHLRPISPTVVAGGEAVPAYRPVELRYRQGNQDCGAAKGVAAGGLLPSLKDAGCPALPDSAQVTFEIDKAKSNPKAVFGAYEDRAVHTMPLLNPGPEQMRFDHAKARRKLPVAFAPEAQRLLNQQYSEPAELKMQAAHIYSDAGCTPQPNARIVELFANEARKASYQWPVWARILDNDGEAMTNCAQAVVASDAKGPFLTFAFESTRAFGPRRVIIIARGQDFMEKRGLPKALEKSLERFIATAGDMVRKGAPLSPVDVLTISQDGTINRAFTGEQAVQDQPSAQSSIARLDRTGPRTPDLSLLRLHPDTKAAQSIVLVMDGSQANAKNVSELRLIASDLSARKGGKLQFVLSSNSCELWQPLSPFLQCLDVSEQAQVNREVEMTKVFTSLLTPPGQEPEPAAAGKDTAPEKAAGAEKAGTTEKAPPAPKPPVDAKPADKPGNKEPR